MKTREQRHAPFNRSYAELSARARQLRRDATPAERVLFEHLRRSQLGVRCRRQKVIGGYIADFYFPQWKLIVELDGDVHRFSGLHDARRDRHLIAMGYAIMRFPNTRALAEPAQVAQAIFFFGQTGVAPHGTLALSGIGPAIRSGTPNPTSRRTPRRGHG